MSAPLDSTDPTWRAYRVAQQAYEDAALALDRARHIWEASRREATPHSDLDTIDLLHDEGIRWLQDPFEPTP